MIEENQSPQPSPELLWREYESCQKVTQNLESIIWQTSGVVGIGSIGTLILVANHKDIEQPPWCIAAIIGLFIFLASLIWWFMARRWWSIQHALFIRMRHIEKRLGVHATRYLQYLDFPCTLQANDLSAIEIKELKDRAEKRGVFAPHQRMGVQSVLWLLPVVNLIAWGLYVAVLISLAAGGLGEGDIKSDLKQIHLSASGNHLVLQGKWRNVTERPSVTIPKVNSVRIECDKGALICTEYIAKLIQKSDDPLRFVDKRYLFLMKEEFRVFDWSDSVVIVARAEPRVADIELQISLKDSVAKRTSRETGTRGAEGADPRKVEQWILD